MKDELALNVKIKNIDVDEYYSTIEYTYTINGKQKKGEHNEDYEGWGQKEWKKMLESGEALRVVLQDIAEKY